VIRRIGRIGLILPSLAFVQPGSGQLFTVAAILDEGPFESGNLLVEQVVGLMRQMVVLARTAGSACSSYGA
jgi:hypothetical protein